MEEDIEMLETELEEVLCLLVEKRCFEYAQQIGKAIENLIKGYRELKEMFDDIEHEHDRLDKRNNELIFELKDSIPKSKIKEKIEELEKQKEETYTKFLAGNRKDEFLSTKGKMLQGAIQVLQELMEDK